MLCIRPVGLLYGSLGLCGSVRATANLLSVRSSNAGSDGASFLVRALIDGGEGNYLIWGGCGDDVLVGGSGHDLIWGGDGADAMLGGRGSTKMLARSDLERELYEGRPKAKRDMQTLETMRQSVEAQRVQVAAAVRGGQPRTRGGQPRTDAGTGGADRPVPAYPSASGFPGR